MNKHIQMIRMGACKENKYAVRKKFLWFYLYMLPDRTNWTWDARRAFTNKDTAKQLYDWLVMDDLNKKEQKQNSKLKIIEHHEL